MFACREEVEADDDSVPVVRIQENKARSDVAWLSYSGQPVDVIFEGTEHEKIRQRVFSLEDYTRDRVDLDEVLGQLVLHQTRRDAEAGAWIVRTNDGFSYSSEVFSSGERKKLRVEDIVSALRSFDLAEVLPHDALITEVILAHSHPIWGEPLSAPDVRIAKHFAGPFSCKFTVLAVSGSLVFEAVVKK